MVEFADYLSDRELYVWLMDQLGAHMAVTPGSFLHFSPIGGCSEEDNQIYPRTTRLMTIALTGRRALSMTSFRRRRGAAVQTRPLRRLIVRHQIVGRLEAGRVLLVSFTERADVVRIISSRKADR